ncbi:RNA-directed DNA polymerase, eukaryota [Tanacetum coccineum]
MSPLCEDPSFNHDVMNLMLSSIPISRGRVVFSGDGFTAIIVNWRDVLVDFVMVNVYAPQNSHAKSKLWSELLHLKNTKLGFWICFGDFNVVREESDRKGTHFDPNTTYSFNKFIDEVELQEVVMGARNFTRINKKGTKLSKLDRFLISTKVFHTWPTIHSTALPRKFPDHCPILMESNSADFGPVPFKFYNSWLNEDSINLFLENTPRRTYFHSNKFKSISELQKCFLERPFEYDEIKKAVWSCGEDKSPGPDGFTFRFIKSLWNLIGDDFTKAVKFFEIDKSIARGCISSFIYLIPKISNPFLRQDLCPISLVGCYYKVLSKLLANRLEYVMSTLISNVQTAFLKDRQITDGPLIINEVISWTKKVNGKFIIFKVDFEKAFDSINWNFIDDIMGQMGFGVKWRDWIFGFLRLGFSSILINGSPSKEFKLEQRFETRGFPDNEIPVRALHFAMMEAREKEVFKGVEVGKNKVVISHLQYADDALLVVNLNKSRLLGVGVKNDEVIRVARSEKQVFLAWWDEEKKVSWVAWSKVCAPVKLGGLGIGSLKALNLSLISKWLWRWRTNKDALWYHILHSIHGSKGGDFLTYASIDTKGSWYEILKACHDVNSLSIPLSSFFTRSIGEGASIKFWDEEWLGTFKLADVFPRLYALESMKDCNISGRLIKLNDHLSSAWNWRRPIRNGREKEEIDSLTCLIQGVELKSGPDGWSWALKSSGKFSVKSLRVKLDEKILTSSHEKTRWNSLVLKKVNILVWRVDKDSLATRSNLDKRSIDLHSVLCLMCEEDVESLDHLMGRCSWSRSIWNFIFKWRGFSLSGDFNYKCVCNFDNRLSTEKKRMFSPFHL